jgi:hypothetical protein
MRATAQGYARARYWRALGWPNLVRARAAKARYRLARKQLEEARRFSPFADPNDTSRGG